MRRDGRGDLLVLLGLAAVACVFWRVDVIGSGTTVASFQNVDLFTEFYPRHAFARAALRRGEMPLWDAHQIGGLPFLATLQAGFFYPPNLLYGLLPVGIAMGVLALGHLFLAGAFTFLLGRELGFTRAASALAGLTFMVGGSTVSLVYHTNAINSAPWLPAAILCAWRLGHGGGARAALWLSGVLALQLLAGRDYTFVMTVHAVGLLALMQAGWMLRDGDPPARVARYLGWLALAAVLAVGIAGAQLLPTLRLAAEGERGMSGLPREFLEVYGPLPPAFFFANLVNPVRGVVRREYLGWIPLAFFAIGFGLWGRGRATGFASLLALLALVLAFGSETPLYDAYRLLPLGATFRLPDRFVFLFAFGAALVAASGFDRVFAGAGRRRVLPTVWPLLALGVVVLLAVDGRWVAAGLRAAAEPWSWFTFYGFEKGHFEGLRLARWYLAGVVLVVAAGIWRGGSTGGRALRAMVVVLTAADLTWALASRVLHPARDASPAASALPCYAQAAAVAGPTGRHLSVRTRGSWALKDKDGELFGRFAVTHYDPLVTRRHAAYFEALQEGGAAIVETPWNARSRFMGFLTRYPTAERAKLLDLLGMRAVLVDAADAGTPALRGIVSRLEREVRCPATAEAPAIEVFRNPHALERAFVVHDVRPVNDVREAMDRLVASGFDPRRQAVVEGAVPLPPGDGRGAVGEADIVAYGDTEVRVHASSSAPGLLVLTDAWDAEWTATRNGEPAAIVPTDGLFRGVVVPEGSSEIVFRYVPASFHRGLLLSIVASGVWGVLLWRTRAGRVSA